MAAPGRPFEPLMPSTIFDRDPDMDISEEMEEIREVLYALIKSHFPMGVSSAHLAEKYHEEYVATGMGRELPPEWLEQVMAAEEFETQIRGPLTILFVRLSNTSSFRRPHIPVTNMRIIASGKETANYPLESEKPSPPLPSARKSPRDIATQLESSVLDNQWVLPMKVHISHINSPNDFYIISSDPKRQDELRGQLNDYYQKNDEGTRVELHEVCVNGAYAVVDENGDWHRVIILSCESGGMAKCSFVDNGRSLTVPVDKIRFLSCPQMVTSSLAARCSLDIPQDHAQAKTDAFKKMVTDAGAPIIVKAALIENVKSLRTIKLTLLDDKNVKDALLKSGSTEKENRSPPSSQPGTRPTSTTSLSLTAPLLNFVDDPEIQPMSVQEMPATTFYSHALFAAGPADISMRQTSMDPMPDYMYEKLAEECSLPAAALVDSPVPGSFYGAFIEERWERVICVRGSKVDPASFCVYLVDVGAFHYVRGEAMRRLNAKTPFKKMLMFKAKVAGIVPIGGADVWSREAHLATREFFEASLGEHVEVTPISFPKTPRTAETKTAWNKWKQLNAPTVPVVEARISVAGRDLADWLMGCGLAVPAV
ncbi:unnamed protein product, partial [Mesorhabditis spiculigera]